MMPTVLRARPTRRAGCLGERGLKASPQIRSQKPPTGAGDSTESFRLVVRRGGWGRPVLGLRRSPWSGGGLLRRRRALAALRSGALGAGLLRSLGALRSGALRRLL